MFDEQDLLKELGVITIPREFPASKIRQSLFVRERLNEEYALQLALKIEASQSETDETKRIHLPPVLVVPRYEVGKNGVINLIPDSDETEIVYGRHRYHAEAICLDYDTIKCLLITGGVATVFDLIAIAYKENSFGRLALSDRDIKHTIRELLKQKYPESKIPDLLGQPVRFLRKYIQEVKSEMKLAVLRKGHEIVLEGRSTVRDAAEQVGAPAEDLRRYIAGETRGRKQGKAEEVARNIKSSFNRANQVFAANMKLLFAEFDEGVVSAPFVYGVFKSVERSRQRGQESATDWKKRFDAKVNGNGMGGGD